MELFLYLFLILDGLYGFLFLTLQHFIVVTELRAFLERYLFLLSLKGNPFPELLLEFNLICLGLLDSHRFGTCIFILAYLTLELIYLLLELSFVGYVLVHLLLLLHVDTDTEKLVRVGLGLLYLHLQCFIAGLQKLLCLVELPDPILTELITLEEQIVHTLEIEVLSLLSVAHISEPSHLFRR